MKTPSSTHDRLAVAAAKIFYRDGITASGVDAVVRYAGISKPTLYTHYRSKSELVAAALDVQHQARRRMMQEYLEQRGGQPPAERLLGIFDWLETWSQDQGVRGCAFLNAAAELAGPQDEMARQVVREHKQWWLTLLTDLARDAGAVDPVRLADELLLLMDGVSARVLVMGQAGSAASARRVARLLLQESLTHSPHGMRSPAIVPSGAPGRPLKAEGDSEG